MYSIMQYSVLLVVFLVVAVSCQDLRAQRKIIQLKYKSNATFDCSQFKEAEYFQSKAGVETKYEGNEKNVKLEDNILTLFDLRGEELNADYLCRAKNDHAKKIEFIKQIVPQLYKPDKMSQTVSEGNKVEFKCTLLFGHQKPEKTKWEWSFKNKSNLLSNIDGKININSNENETMLTLLNVVDADKGEYECMVSTQHGSHSETVHLRVKDALAALWPFLAIVAEVLILCVILLVYEKKCSKKRNTGEDENEQAQNLMGRDGNADLKKRSVKA